MNDGMYNAFRSYLEEHSSLLRQLLEAQNKTNEILSQLAAENDYMVHGGSGPVPLQAAKLKGQATEAAGSTPPKTTPKKGK